MPPAVRVVTRSGTRPDPRLPASLFSMLLTKFSGELVYEALAPDWRSQSAVSYSELLDQICNYRTC